VSTERCQATSAPLVKLTEREQKVLATLRANTEGTSVLQGPEWGTVCLANGQPDGMASRVYAGVLSSLERKGLYKPQGDDCFGWVKLEEEPRYCCNGNCKLQQPHVGACSEVAA